MSGHDFRAEKLCTRPRLRGAPHLPEVGRCGKARNHPGLDLRLCIRARLSGAPHLPEVGRCGKTRNHPGLDLRSCIRARLPGAPHLPEVGRCGKARDHHRLDLRFCIRPRLQSLLCPERAGEAGESNGCRKEDVALYQGTTFSRAAKAPKRNGLSAPEAFPLSSSGRPQAEPRFQSGSDWKRELAIWHQSTILRRAGQDSASSRKKVMRVL